MADQDPIALISRALDMIGDDLEGHPLEVSRPGKEDFVLVSSETYSNLLSRIHILEQAAMTAEERSAEESDLLSMLKKSD